MTLSVEEYLRRDGAIELLCEIDPNGFRFTDLEEALSISQTTLSRRLAEGRDASLLQREPITGERGTTHLHVLSPKGGTLRHAMDGTTTTMTYRQLKDTRQQFQDKKEDIREWARTELPKFNRADHSRLLETLQRRPDFYIKQED